jgi:hypothetical protein
MDKMRSLSMPGSEDLRETIRKPYKSTFEWVEDDPIIHKWMRDDSQVIWVFGELGSGKFVISKHLLSRIYELHESNHPQGAEAILSFFFDGRGSAQLGSEELSFPSSTSLPDHYITNAKTMFSYAESLITVREAGCHFP